MTSERIEFARSLRRSPTRAEDVLWAQLRGSRFHGAKFKRQVPFDRYVVDFYCHAAKLVVEIDGKQHEWLSGYDEGRGELLSASACASFTSATKTSATTSTLFSSACAKRCVCPLFEAPIPSPLPLSLREREARSPSPERQG